MERNVLQFGGGGWGGGGVRGGGGAEGGGGGRGGGGKGTFLSHMRVKKEGLRKWIE